LLEAAAREAGGRLQKRIRKLEQEAIAAMKNHGLKVHAVPEAAEREWKTLVREKGYPVFVGSRFSKEMFDTVRRILDEYRRSSGLKPPGGR
jgi:TRAP-type C4-dicarboxylate transport system substrate-binding protein